MVGCTNGVYVVTLDHEMSFKSLLPAICPVYVLVRHNDDIITPSGRRYYYTIIIFHRDANNCIFSVEV